MADASGTSPPNQSMTPDAGGPATSPAFGRSVGFVAGGMGDQIYHLTQLRALAGASAAGQIDLACIHPGPIGRLLEHTPWVGQIIDARPYRRYLPGLRGQKEVRALGALQHDSGFILHRSTSFKLAAWAAGIPLRVGLSDGWLDRRLLNHPLDLSGGGERRALWGHRPFIAAIDAYVQSLGLGLDMANPTIMPGAGQMKTVARMLAELPRPVCVINLFALDEKRRWPLESALAVIAGLARKTGGSFILNAGPDARAYHEAALRQWAGMAARTTALKKTPLVDSLALDPSMQRDVALYHQADLYIGVDSFTANLALNCNLPAVVLFAHDRDVLRYRDAVHPIVTPKPGEIGAIGPDEIMAGAMVMKRSAYPLPL